MCPQAEAELGYPPPPSLHPSSFWPRVPHSFVSLACVTGYFPSTNLSSDHCGFANRHWVADGKLWIGKSVTDDDARQPPITSIKCPQR